ncbi:MAG: DAK2 domain-containing protein [Treponema sp.]|nr:DAK2 domain-containing protein [Treponema sp.]
MICENTIDGGLLRRMLHSGFTSLSHNKNYLNDLNIFPVSDSDTGTNMKKTFKNGIAAINGEFSFHDVFSSFVNGILLGSRGNSGFILSQYFLGIYDYIKNKDEPVTIGIFSCALQHAYEIAYRAVIHPAEGTMLTVMRDGIEKTLPRLNDKTSVKDFFDVLTEEMFLCVQETVKQMDVLRENNVVDSGALGFYLIFDGMKKSLNDDLVHFNCEQSELLPKRIPILVKSISFFRYCTEFVLRMYEEKNKDFFVRLLSKRGDSIVVAADKSVLKVHIHTNEPREIMDEFSKYGDIAVRKVDDLFQTEEFERLKLRKHTDFAIVAFTKGEGNAAILEQLGADIAFNVPSEHYPSEEELKKLIGEFLKENLIIFANDKETHERLRRIKWFSNLQNVYVAESESLSKTFFMLSSLVFTDEFKNIVKSLENLKKQHIFQTYIKTTVIENSTQYSGFLKNKLITTDNFEQLLDTVADEEILRSYSTVIIFSGKYCKQKDIKSIHVHFEKNSNIEFSFIEGKQHESDFIIGAY